MKTTFNFSALFPCRGIQLLNVRRHHASATLSRPGVEPFGTRCRPGRALVLAVALLAFGSVEAWAQDDNADLQALALLTGTNYVNQRSILLQQHPLPYDIGSASAYSWGAGLAAYILDAWQADPADFTNWTAAPMVENELVQLESTAVIDAGTNGQAFWIEQVWKTAPTTNAAADALTSLLRLPLNGTVPLWSAVYYSSPAGPPPGLPPAGDPLQQIAAHALASLPGQAFTPSPVIDALSNPAVTQTVTLAALSGLEQNGPPDTTTVLQSTEPSWSTNLDSLSAGYLAFSAQTNSGGRNVVYSVAQDTSQTVETRMIAVAAFTAQPLTNDIVVLQEILSNNVPPEMTNQIDGELDFYNDFFGP